jgi:hypothetical protein
MIGYFIMAGDTKVEQNFDPYIWPYRNIIHEVIVGKNYGSGLKLILIEYLLAGKFMAVPKKRIYRTPLRKKEQALSVRFGVPIDFVDWDRKIKKNFIVTTTNEAVQLVRKYLLKKEDVDIEFALLLSDLEQCAAIYLGQP